MAESAHKVELTVELCIELVIALYPLGAEQMNLPHNFWVGICLWIIATAIAVRMLWICPGIKRLHPKLKASIATVFVVAFVLIARTPVMNAYRKLQQPPVQVVAAATSQTIAKTNPEGQQNKKPSVQQNSNGADSPNTSIIGNGNTVNNTVNNQDPEVTKRLEEITTLLKVQQGAQFSPKILLAKYPLGYGIFDADHTDRVFPYDTAHMLEGWNIDWNKLQINRNNAKNGLARIGLPNVTVHGMKFEQNSMDVDLRIGAMLNGGAALFDDGTAALKGEVLAVTDEDIVILFGFVRSAPGAVLFGRPKPENKGRYAGQENHTP